MPLGPPAVPRLPLPPDRNARPQQWRSQQKDSVEQQQRPPPEARRGPSRAVALIGDGRGRGRDCRRACRSPAPPAEGRRCGEHCPGGCLAISAVGKAPPTRQAGGFLRLCALSAAVPAAQRRRYRPRAQRPVSLGRPQVPGEGGACRAGSITAALGEPPAPEASPASTQSQGRFCHLLGVWRAGRVPAASSTRIRSLSAGGARTVGVLRQCGAGDVRATCIAARELVMRESTRDSVNLPLLRS